MVLQTIIRKKWSGYGVAFGKQNYLHKDSGKNANNLIILGADLSDSSDEETKKNNILILGSVQINNTTIQAKSELKTNCTLPPKFILSVHYNGDNSYLFVKNIQQYKFKAKDSEIKTRKLCLGGFSNDSLSDFTAMSKVYHFSVDYQLATKDKIQKIHKMSYVPKYLSESSSIKHVTVDLQLEGVATKKDLEGITHLDTSSFALKTNLSA